VRPAGQTPVRRSWRTAARAKAGLFAIVSTLTHEQLHNLHFGDA
jgi:hypothetical protein